MLIFVTYVFAEHKITTEIWRDRPIYRPTPDSNNHFPTKTDNADNGVIGPLH